MSQLRMRFYARLWFDLFSSVSPARGPKAQTGQTTKPSYMLNENRPDSPERLTHDIMRTAQISRRTREPGQQIEPSPLNWLFCIGAVRNAAFVCVCVYICICPYVANTRSMSPCVSQMRTHKHERDTRLHANLLL